MAREPKETEAAEEYEPPKVKGGVYKDAEGDGFHNAHGEPVTEDGELLEAETAEEEVVEDTDDWKDDMEAQKKASAEGSPAKATRKRKRGKG